MRWDCIDELREEVEARIVAHNIGKSMQLGTQYLTTLITKDGKAIINFDNLRSK